MNATYPTPNQYPPGGSPAELRQSVAGLMATVGMRAGMAVDYAAISDDAGLAYTLRCAAAEFRAALSAAGMLAEITKAEREARRNPSTGRHSVLRNPEVRA